jgi:RNA polymerase sigma factor (sigma-70 family)
MPMVEVASVFPTTRWSQVVAAGAGAEQALEELCRIYWRPLYAYARRRGLRPVDAEDAIQDFFAHFLVDGFARAQADRGCFRSFLLTALLHRLHDGYDHATAACRDQRRVVWLDALDAERRLQLEPVVTDSVSPEAAFDREWALAVLAETRQRLAEEYQTLGQQATFSALEPWLTITGTPAETLAAALGTTPGTAKVAMHRLRQRWRDLLRLRIADTVAEVGEIDDELRYLAAAAETR